MKRHVAIVAAACLLLSLGSCRKARFQVEAELHDCPATALRAVYYCSDKEKGWYNEAVLTLADGRGSLVCATSLPTLLYLSDTGSAHRDPLVVYARRGDDITLAGSGADMQAWEVGGNDVNEEWSRWRRDNLAALAAADPARRNAAVAAYVRRNPGRLLSALLLLTTFDSQADPSLSARLWNSLDPDIRDDKTIALGATPGRLTPHAAATAPLPAFTLRVRGDSLVSRKAAGHTSTLLWFWSAGDPSRQAVRDTLRALAARHKGLQLVDVSFDADSLRWLDAMRRDSLDALHAWAPAGIASPTAETFGVRRTPAFVVLDNKGARLYHGYDAARAAARAR